MFILERGKPSPSPGKVIEDNEQAVKTYVTGLNDKVRG